MEKDNFKSDCHKRQKEFDCSGFRSLLSRIVALVNAMRNSAAYKRHRFNLLWVFALGVVFLFLFGIIEIRILFNSELELPSFTGRYGYDAVSDHVLDFEDLPKLAGPPETPPKSDKILVVCCIGKTDKVNMNRLMTKIFTAPDAYSFMFFHYDNTTWHEFAWYNQIDVVAVRVVHKMKYWYIKRFISPNIAKGFSNIFIIDADVEFESSFDPLMYTAVTKYFSIALSAPARSKDDNTTNKNIITRSGDHIGRYTAFVEGGPAVMISSVGYQCLYSLMQPDLTTGWGFDLLWADYTKRICKLGSQSVAILDAFILYHRTPTGEGTASSHKGFNDLAMKEYEIYIKRFPYVKERWGTKESNDKTFGKRKCIRTRYNPKAPYNFDSCT